ncbi:MAG: GWxTD domain-containing protein [bacterium]|nr:GWxTD domain-containing protein [bacterium]
MRFQFFVMIIFIASSAITLAAKDDDKVEEQQHAFFRLILSDELQQVYDDIYISAEKNSWERKYWKISDPTPNTERNEYYQEFSERVEYAKNNYSNIIAPLFIDDRGKYYIKYGEPDDKVISVGIGKPWEDNETWVYYDLNLYIDFVYKIGFGFREVNSLFEAVTSGPSNTKVHIASNLYLERETLHQKYSKFRNISDGSHGLMAESYFYQWTEDLSLEKKIMLETIPPSKYSFSYNKQPLHAAISSSLFRADLGFSRVEFYYLFPLNELSFQSGSQVPFETLVNKEVVIFNQKFEKMLQKNETLKLFAENQEQINRRIYINQHNEELHPGIYNIALKLDNIGGERMAILRAQLNVRDFSADSLLVSDIQFSSNIRENVQEARNLKPNGIQVFPYVGNTISKARPIYLYFEVYSLATDTEDRSRFKIEYEVKSLSMENISALTTAIQFITRLGGKKGKETIGSSFESEGEGEFQQIYLAIDFSDFPAGLSQITIHITDLKSNKSTSAQKRFVLK